MNLPLPRTLHYDPTHVDDSSAHEKMKVMDFLTEPIKPRGKRRRKKPRDPVDGRYVTISRKLLYTDGNSVSKLDMWIGRLRYSTEYNLFYINCNWDEYGETENFGTVAYANGIVNRGFPNNRDETVWSYEIDPEAWQRYITIKNQ